MLDIAQFREFIIKPALHDLVLDSPEAEELLVFTCAVESLGGRYIKQIEGPALGIYQMEPRTYVDIWENYIKPRPSLFMIIGSNFDAHFMPDEQRLMYDLRFATAMARIHYARVREKLPPSNDVEAIWYYYKKYYNTSWGSAQKDSAINDYQNWIVR